MYVSLFLSLNQKGKCDNDVSIQGTFKATPNRVSQPKSCGRAAGNGRLITSFVGNGRQTMSLEIRCWYVHGAGAGRNIIYHFTKIIVVHACVHVCVYEQEVTGSDSTRAKATPNENVVSCPPPASL